MTRLIDADALKGEKFYSHERHENCVSVYAIDMMPTIEPERPHGEWTDLSDGWQEGTYECSNCKTEFVLIEGTPKDNEYHFCPNCGASMLANDRQVTGKLKEGEAE